MTPPLLKVLLTRRAHGSLMALLYGTKASPVSDAHHLLKNLASRNHGAHRRAPRKAQSSPGPFAVPPRRHDERQAKLAPAFGWRRWSPRAACDAWIPWVFCAFRDAKDLSPGAPCLPPTSLSAMLNSPWPKSSGGSSPKSWWTQPISP